ncbi:type II toxin-antitoxin system VapC family toxin [bacterium]|nr:type II toxin-antitoxin system VapC family toxin [bacterium]
MKVYVLDTTTLTHLQQSHPRVLTRYVLAVTAGDSTGTTTVNVDEYVGGWTARIQRSRSPVDEARFAGRLAEAMRMFADLTIHPTSVPAIARFEQPVRMKLNVGRSDLKIAAVALEVGATVVTDNLRDFGRVPYLVVENWLV